MTKSGIAEELGTMQFLWDGISLQESKSPEHAYQFILFFAEEDTEVGK